MAQTFVDDRVMLAGAECPVCREIGNHKSNCLILIVKKNAYVQQHMEKAVAGAIEQCAIEAGERSPEGVSSHTMLGNMWDDRIAAHRSKQAGPVCTCTQLKASTDHPAGRVTRSTCPIHGQAWQAQEGGE